MPEHTLDEIAEYVGELRKRARTSQADARQRLNPLFSQRDDPRKGPADFVESSYLYMRSCDADSGSRPMPCPVFWLSPDLRVAPLSNLGAATRELRAGDAYRMTATVRNRGDLMVPSANVEFWLVTPSLGFDVRYATKLGVAAGRVQAAGATEVSLDCIIPPSASGHRCLFARVFSFAPLDIPVDDYALDPVIDRHVAQLNLNIVAQSTTFVLDWVHLRNATERLEIVPMDRASLKMLRFELVSQLTVATSARSRDLIAKIGIRPLEAEHPGAAVSTERIDGGLALRSIDPDAVSLDEQAALTKQVQSALKKLQGGRGDARAFAKTFAAYRAMTAQTVQTRIELSLPDFGLKRSAGVPLQVIRRDVATGAVRGGIALIMTG